MLLLYSFAHFPSKHYGFFAMKTTILTVVLSVCVCIFAQNKSVEYYEYNSRVNGQNGQYNFGFRTSDGIERSEVGTNAAQEVTGSYSYFAPNGQKFTVYYKAGAAGYQILPAPSQPSTPLGPVQLQSTSIQSASILKAPLFEPAASDSLLFKKPLGSLLPPATHKEQASFSLLVAREAKLDDVRFASRFRGPAYLPPVRPEVRQICECFGEHEECVLLDDIPTCMCITGYLGNPILGCRRIYAAGGGGGDGGHFIGSNPFGPKPAMSSEEKKTNPGRFKVSDKARKKVAMSKKLCIKLLASLGRFKDDDRIINCCHAYPETCSKNQKQ